MSLAEFLALAAALLVAAFFWGRWLALKLSLQQLAPEPSPEFAAVVFSLMLSANGLIGVLVLSASASAGRNGLQLVLYWSLGAALVAFAVALLGRLGLSLRTDVIEHRNPAATFAVAGALAGFTSVYAGATLGGGPGWAFIVGRASVSIIALLLGWSLLTSLTSLRKTLSDGRNRAAGIRVGAWFIASGILLGDASAVPWVDRATTLVVSGRVALGAAALLGLTLVVEIALRARVARPAGRLVASGLLPAAFSLLVTAAALYLAHRG